MSNKPEEYPRRRPSAAGGTTNIEHPQRGKPVEPAAPPWRPANAPSGPAARAVEDTEPSQRPRPEKTPEAVAELSRPAAQVTKAKAEPEPEPGDLAETGRSIARSAKRAIEPKLSGLWEQVFEVLQQYGPQTANEVVNRLPPTNLSNNNVRSRLTELVKLGRVVINREVRDPVSGRRVREYRVAAPVEIPPPSVALRSRRASRAQLEAEIARLRAENEALKAKLSGAGSRNDDPR